MFQKTQASKDRNRVQRTSSYHPNYMRRLKELVVPAYGEVADCWHGRLRASDTLACRGKAPIQSKKVYV
jgi:hypothetical protein